MARPQLRRQVTTCAQLHHHAAGAAVLHPCGDVAQDVAVVHIGQDQQLLQAGLTLLVVLARQPHFLQHALAAISLRMGCGREGGPAGGCRVGR